jgi:enamine deaminase RidA (YjgF/YER057c/UK114 family)
MGLEETRLSEVEQRLAALGLELAAPTAPVANYVPFVRTGSLVHISGQVSIDANGGIKGIVGVDLDMDESRAAARHCGLNLLAQMKVAADDDLDRVVRVVKLNGFIQAGPEFYEIPRMLNGCSDLMVEAFGDAGRHARSAVGVYRLPLNFAVEVDAVVQIK